MMTVMVVIAFLLKQAPAGVLDAGDGPILTQFRVDPEDPMDKAMLDGLASELSEYTNLDFHYHPSA